MHVANEIIDFPTRPVGHMAGHKCARGGGQSAFSPPAVYECRTGRGAIFHL